MQVKINILKTVNITRVFISLPVRYGDEDIPYDFPLRSGDVWEATIFIESGRILYWPQGVSGYLFMKVCDSGCYNFIDDDGNCVQEICDYVPHEVIPGEFGDYVKFNIDESGFITNWSKNLKLQELFNRLSENNY